MSTPGGLGALADIIVRFKAQVDQFKQGVKDANDTVARMRVNLGRLNLLGQQGIGVYSYFGLTLDLAISVTGALALL